MFGGFIFDVDGTLVDSNDAHAAAFEEAFNERGLEIPFARIRRLIGKGSDKLLPELTGIEQDSPQGRALAERKKAIFKQRHLARLRPFPGVRSLLEELRERGVRMAVASSAGKDELGGLLAAADAEGYFETQTDADDAEYSKPDPDIVCAALGKLRLPAAQCVLIGDTPYDAEAAARAGLAFVGLRCGGWSDADLRPARAVFDNPADLRANLGILLNQ